jgi:hypothetical protein
MEDQAILVRDCQQRSRSFSGASEGRGCSNEGYIDHCPLQSRANAFSTESSRRLNRASCSESREAVIPIEEQDHHVKVVVFDSVVEGFFSLTNAPGFVQPAGRST